MRDGESREYERSLRDGKTREYERGEYVRGRAWSRYERAGLASVPLPSYFRSPWSHQQHQPVYYLVLTPAIGKHIHKVALLQRRGKYVKITPILLTKYVNITYTCTSTKYLDIPTSCYTPTFKNTDIYEHAR